MRKDATRLWLIIYVNMFELIFKLKKPTATKSRCNMQTTANSGPNNGQNLTSYG